MDKLEKLKAEILRLKSLLPGDTSYLDDYEKGCAAGREDAYDTLLSCIDTTCVGGHKFKVGELIRNQDGTIMKVLELSERGYRCHYESDNFILPYDAERQWRAVDGTNLKSNNYEQSRTNQKIR